MATSQTLPMRAARNIWTRCCELSGRATILSIAGIFLREEVTNSQKPFWKELSQRAADLGCGRLQRRFGTTAYHWVVIAALTAVRNQGLSLPRGCCHRRTRH